MKPIIALLIVSLTFAQERFPLPASGNVTLPLGEYNKLVDQASKQAKKPDSPPSQYALNRAELQLEASNDSAVGKIHLAGETLINGVIKLPLLSGATLVEAKQGGSVSLPLLREGVENTALLDGPGPFEIEMEAMLPLTIDPGRATLRIPPTNAASVRLTLTVPGDQTYVSILDGFIVARRSSNGKSIVEAVLNPGRMTTLIWATRESASVPVAPKPSRFLSDVKTLVSVSEGQVALAVMVDINVVQGEPEQFEITMPAGYEVTATSGATLSSIEPRPGALLLHVNQFSARTHQFIISMERSESAMTLAVPILQTKNSQRETGEVLVEGEGAIELTAKEGGALKRMDVKETNPFLRALARAPVHAAFRYFLKQAELPTLSLQWTRFPDANVLPAVAQQATATTLVTSEGRSLTEVKLIVRNQSQPFLKVTLPAGSSVLSAEVAGEKVKPAKGTDGDRIPLLRAGFRPAGPYPVSFVFVHSGAPFARKGGAEISLPKMDVPVGLLEWELFLPQQYQVKDFAGDALQANLMALAPAGATDSDITPLALADSGGGSLMPGQLGGLVLDTAGGSIVGARVEIIAAANGVPLRTVTDSSGRWLVSSLVSGTVQITVFAAGFQRSLQSVRYDARYPAKHDVTLQVGSVSETVSVSASQAAIKLEKDSGELKKKAVSSALDQGASTNVQNLQRRVSGVLPINIDIPKTGRSFRFIRPLVLDEETKVTFTYKTGK